MNRDIWVCPMPLKYKNIAPEEISATSHIVVKYAKIPISGVKIDQIVFLLYNNNLSCFIFFYEYVYKLMKC